MIQIRLKPLIKLFTITAILLILIHLSIAVTYYLIADPEKFDFIDMFDLDIEYNIPTFFSSLLFLFNGILFWLLGKAAHQKRKYWFGLSAIFIFLAFDESTKIHENIGDFTEKFVDASGALFFPWVISYMAIVGILGLVYLRFFLAMPKGYFLRFMLAAFIFLSGAIGLELLGAQEAYRYGTESPLYTLYYTIEESLEMFGLIYLMHILSDMLDGTKLQLKAI